MTIGCGTTCGCLGDERNLREFLVADETARRLRKAGHMVVSLLIDDSFDPLSYRQLRIALNKDETLLQEWSKWCGKPIAHVPDPWGCHSSYAAHHEEILLERLNNLGCHPNLVSTASLYDHGMYTPYVQQVLERYDEIMDYLTTRFSGYQPETLFRPLCESCGRIDETRIESISRNELKYHCHHCDQTHTAPIDDIKGKLNWKLDCAVRWTMLGIKAEPFNKAYLEPQTGSFVVSQELAKTFFGGHDVLPLHYGLVQIDKSLSYRLVESLPADVLRGLFLERTTADLRITTDYVLNVASRHKVDYGLSYLECVKQLVPMWLLKPQSLTDRQRELIGRGIRFAGDFLGHQISIHLPNREHIEQMDFETLVTMHSFLSRIIHYRTLQGGSWDAFCEQTKQLVRSLGDQKTEIVGNIRAIVGQKQGVPLSRLLYLLPVNYLETIEYLLHLRIGAVNRIVRLPETLIAQSI